MGVDHGGNRGTSPPPRIWSGGDANANCSPPRFCHIGTKISVLWPSKYAKIRFRPGLCPGPRWGSSRRSPDPLVGWRGDTPPHAPPHSARTHLRRSACVPQKSSQIYAYGNNTSSSAIVERPRCKVGYLWPKVEDWNWERIFYGHYTLCLKKKHPRRF